MVNFAVNRQVNPPGALPKLTEAQLWKGLEMKARDPLPFVAAITFCEILSDTGDKIVRKVRIGKAEPIEEVVNLYKGTIVYFNAQPEGLQVTNVLSYDKDDELVLMFSFANGVPGTEHLGDSPSISELNKAVGAIVEHTIEKVRELVKEGTLKV